MFMSNYVSLDKIGAKGDSKGFYLLALRKIAGINCDYRLSFKMNETYKEFSRTIVDVISVSAGYSYIKDNQGGGTAIIHLNSDEPSSKYVMKIQANEWFENNKDKIVSSLIRQASIFEMRAKNIKELDNIEKSLNEGNYADAICKMIIKHAGKMTLDELNKIQATAVAQGRKKQQINNELKPKC